MESNIDIIVPLNSFHKYRINLQNLLENDFPPSFHFIFVADNLSSHELTLLGDMVKAPNQIILSGCFGSAGKARNAGLKKAKSDWVVFLDADDILDPTQLQSVLTFAVDSGCDVAISGLTVHSEVENRSVNHYFDTKLKASTGLGRLPAFTRIVYRSKFIADLKFEDLSMAEDLVFLVDVFNKDPKISVVNSIYYTYKIHLADQSTTNLAYMVQLFDAIKVLDSRLEQGPNNLAMVFLLRLAFSFMFRLPRKSLTSIFVIYKILGRSFFRYPIMFIQSFYSASMKRVNLL